MKIPNTIYENLKPKLHRSGSITVHASMTYNASFRVDGGKEVERNNL